MQAAAALWALSLLGRLLSVWRLLALGALAALTLPVAVDANRHRLEKAWHDGSRAVQVQGSRRSNSAATCDLAYAGLSSCI